MAIFKRGQVWWFGFWWKGERIQKSTKIKIGPKQSGGDAKDIEAAFRVRLAKGETGTLERNAAPTLRDFSQRFIDAIQVRCQSKPATIAFYGEQLSRLLEFDPLATARLDAINEDLIEQFIQWRSQQQSRAGANRKGRRRPKVKRVVSLATVNRALAVLRRLLRLAHEWRLIDHLPHVRLLSGERNREFILSHAEEQVYLEAARQPLRDVATLILDTGLRIGEALGLEWADIHLEPAPNGKFGYVHVRDGKSRFARRNVPLTARASTMFQGRKARSESPWVFAEGTTKPMRSSSLDHLHRELRQALNMPGEFVLHSLRHTYGTRLGEAGADAFSIMNLMGHSSVTISQRYVHPTPEALERAVQRLENLNKEAMSRFESGQKCHLLTTNSTTVEDRPLVSH